MPSPFPGMDPYLETPFVWPGFHDNLVIQTVAVLQPQLRARGYFIDSNERVWLTEPHRPIYPDNVIFERRRPRQPEEADTTSATTLVADEPLIVRLADVEVRETFLEIYDRASHRIVTGIEYISPTNKSDTQGRELYQRKQAETSEAGINLVEIDFIRRGPSVVDVPETVLDALPQFDYLVHLGRREAVNVELYLIGIRDKLPRIRIPLKAGDQDAVLDLQEVFNRAYDIGPYPERLNYQADPVPPLGDEDAAWADELLRSKGFRQ